MTGRGIAAKTLSHRERVPAKRAGEGLIPPDISLRRIPSSVGFGDTFSLWEKGALGRSA